MNLYHKLRVLGSILLISCALPSLGQTGTTSPYSNFGIGDLVPVTNSRTAAMGGVGIALRGNAQINPLNPASYTSFDSLSFTVEAGMYGNFSTLSTTLVTEKASNAGLAHLYLGFPVTSWYRASFGIMPYSSLGYNIKDMQPDPIMGRALRIYEGDGGLNQYYFGNGFKLGKDFSIGLNIIYLSGKLERSRMLNFPDSVYTLNTRVTNTTSVGDLNFSVGIQYHPVLKNGDKLTLGAVYGHSREISATTEELVETLFGGIDNGTEYSNDTIVYNSDLKGKIKLPMNLGLGFGYERPDKFTFSAEGNYSNWSDYTFFGRTDSLRNSFRVAAGLEFIPDNRSISGYWKKIRYRAGFRYAQTYLKLRNQGIDEYAISFGIGLPLRRMATTINLGGEFGSRGTTDQNLIKDNFFRFTLGISISERWFVIPKYD